MNHQIEVEQRLQEISDYIPLATGATASPYLPVPPMKLRTASTQKLLPANPLSRFIFEDVNEGPVVWYSRNK